MADKNPWTKMTHVALVVHDIEEAVQRYSDLGMGPFKRFQLPSDDFAKFKIWQHFGKPANDHLYEIAWGKFGPIAMEIFQPVKGDSIPLRFLNARGEGIWHYGYDVENMNDTIAWMEARGYEVIGESESEEGVRMIYFGTEEVGGVYFQAHEIPAHSKMYEKLGDTDA